MPSLMADCWTQYHVVYMYIHMWVINAKMKFTTICWKLLSIEFNYAWWESMSILALAQFYG